MKKRAITKENAGRIIFRVLWRHISDGCAWFYIRCTCPVIQVCYRLDL
jgi:hypothetical protein